MIQVCPKCKSENVGGYFCYNCGAVLSFDPTNEESKKTQAPPFVTKEEFIKEKGVFIRYAVIPIALIIACVVLLIVAPLLISARRSLDIVANKENTSKAPDERVIKTELALDTLTFGKENFAAVIPADIDFYVEGSDITKLLPLFTVYKTSFPVGKGEVLFPEFKSTLEDPYAIFSKVYESTGSAKKRSWGVVFKPKNKVFITSLFDTSKESSFSAKIIHDYAVFANDKRIYDEVDDANSKLILNLSLSSKYASAKNSLPVQGKLFILLLTDDIQKDLAGFESSKVFTEDFKKLADDLLKKDKSSYVIQ